ncbi:hypothetical protein HK413_13425 [Mucilaginibacter sp. S1162]|uniref:POTRA domain-containing protein n=1 Tax=Mucilaginibacter humi TaxID=2732510 RepID=A0ABX1W6T4_9SPHI|nr:hypothetical protein [Mucilaginibacter humi]NNU34805.1 hypothetical protein [Mucilaginibacter humi]
MNQNNTSKQSAGLKAKNRKLAVIFSLGTIAIALFLIFGLGLFSKPKVLQTMLAYGKMKHEVTYDKNNITEEEVNYLADGLTKAHFFDETTTKFVYIKRSAKRLKLAYLLTL